MAVVPVVWLAVLHWRGRSVDVAYWWLAGAFAVSWLADAAAHIVDPWLVSAVYPVSQAAIIAAAFLVRRDALMVLGLLVATGLLTVLWRGVSGPDVVLRCVSGLLVCGIVWPLWSIGSLRTALLVYFGGGVVAWLCYAKWPGWPMWLAYQTVRATGLGWFCRACLETGPRLRVLRPGVM